MSEIYDGALTGSSIVNLRINEGCVRIGKAALSGSKSLVSVRCPDTMSVIDSEAFSGCSSLRNVYVGTGMTKFGEDVFPGGLTQVTLHYIADSKSLTGVVGFDAIKNSVTVRAGSAERTVTVEIPVKTGARSISRVSSDGENITYSVSEREDEIISAVLITVDDSRTLEGKLIKIEGTAAEESDTGELRNLFSGTGYTGSGVDAVCKMTLCESFDGRIFLAGNPALPNTVIYSSRDKSGRNNPLYFGTYNYFEDGVGAFPVISCGIQIGRRRRRKHLLPHPDLNRQSRDTENLSRIVRAQRSRVAWRVNILLRRPSFRLLGRNRGNRQAHGHA